MSGVIAGAALAALALLAGCGNEARDAYAQRARTAASSPFPGHLSSGGGTSGQVLQRAASAPTATAPSGTPGIPEGSGGNTSGTAMGGASPGAAVSQQQTEAGPTASAAPAGSQTPASAPAAPSAASAAAAREKAELERAMEVAAQRWRERQAAR